MRKLLLIPLVALALLAACNSARKPSAANFTAAINEYLASHGQVCISIGGQLPIDIPASQQGRRNGFAAKLTVLEHAGLVNATDRTAVVQSLANSLSLSPRKPEPVKRYTATGEGQKYLQTVMTDLGRTSGFCYGQKTVDAITHWTMGSHSAAEVGYTYRIANLAAWAQRPDVQQAFPGIRDAISGAGKAEQIAGVQLTNKGWEVPGT